ncbi:MAG: acyl-homoserine-lactone synthase [Vitreimonas sp.]
MIQIITADNRHLFHHQLMEMHRQRKQVFIDQLRWPLEDIAGVEIDCFDCPEATYLVDINGATGEVAGSTRLLPTNRPHLLGDVFPYLCDDAPPSGDHIWEATRFCPAPDIPKGEPRRAFLARMIAAIIETALLFGIERVTFVAGAALAPSATRAGWNVTPLGSARRVGRDRLRAFAADIDCAGLRAVRAQNQIAAPATRFMSASIAKAA